MRFSLDRVVGVWVAEEGEKVDPDVDNKARRAHSPGHRLLVCLMLGAVSHVLEEAPCRSQDWLGIGRTEFSLASSTAMCRILHKSLTLTNPYFPCL